MNNIFSAMLIGALATGYTGAAFAASDKAEAAYKAAKESADALYKVEREKCNSLSGNPKDVCVDEAKLVEARAKAEAKATYKNTSSERVKARITIAGAEYDLAKTKCGSQIGNEKDVCVKQAKAAHVTAKADAKADKKVTEARTDARDDKSDANYKVALEKCDALAGAAKDTCVAAAKKQYGK